MKYKPTEEQEEILGSGGKGASLVIEALAGAGKTSTLELLSHVLPGRGLYLAFNRAIAQEAKKRFSSNVRCSTMHGLAYGEVGVEYAKRIEGGGNGKLSPMRLMQTFRYAQLGFLTPLARAALVRDTLANFMNSSSEAVAIQHAPEDQIALLALGRTLTEQDQHHLLSAQVTDAAELWEALNPAYSPSPCLRGSRASSPSAEPGLPHRRQ